MALSGDIFGRHNLVGGGCYGIKWVQRTRVLLNALHCTGQNYSSKMSIVKVWETVLGKKKKVESKMTHKKEYFIEVLTLSF